MEITIKTDNQNEFKKLIKFLKKENITVINSSETYRSSDNFKDFKVMEEEIKKYRVKLPKDYKFSREEANSKNINDEIFVRNIKTSADMKTLTKKIKENKIQLLNNSNVRDFEKIKKAAAMIDSIRESHSKVNDGWDSVKIIRKIRSQR
ncbi:MAG: hypothetical protein ABI840_12785 [bacterium]